MVNRKAARPVNRRRPDIPRIALHVSVLLLVAECVAALLFSPHLWVRYVRIEGSETVRGQRLWERMPIAPRTGIVTLPTGRLRRAVEAEPVVARAEVYRYLPDTVIVRIREREPWAVVGVDGAYYTIDQGWVPFRKVGAAEPGLPLIALSPGGEQAIRLGRAIRRRGIADATRCLLWAQARGDFPLEKIRVDQTGKLCLNRRGGAEVQLGSGIDLDKKLNALGVLLAHRPEVGAGDFRYVNLFAYDAPAVFPRPLSTIDPSRKRSE